MQSFVIGAVEFNVDETLLKFAQYLDMIGVDISSAKALQDAATRFFQASAAAAAQGRISQATDLANRGNMAQALAKAVAAGGSLVKQDAPMPVKTVTIDPVPGVKVAPTAANNIVVPKTTLSPRDAMQVKVVSSKTPVTITNTAADATVPTPPPAEGMSYGAKVAIAAAIGGIWWLTRRKAA